MLETQDYFGNVSEGKPTPVLIGSGVPQPGFVKDMCGLRSSGDRRLSTMPQQKPVEDVKGPPEGLSSSTGCGMDADATGRSAAVWTIVSHNSVANINDLGPKVSCHSNGGLQRMAERGEKGCEGINNSSSGSSKGVKRGREPTNLDYLREGVIDTLCLAASQRTDPPGPAICWCPVPTDR